MDFVEVEYQGVHFLPPELESCVLFRWTQRNRYLPIWIAAEDAAFVSLREEGQASRRPQTHDLLIDALDAAGGVNEIRIISYYQGVFIASFVLDSGEELDARATDAVIISRLLDIPIQVSPEVLDQASIYVSDDDLQAYLGLEPLIQADDDTALPDNSLADDDFSGLMESMGVRESDIFVDDFFDIDSSDHEDKN
ncbi:bifunctional nuclease family protein [Corynebacterium sp. sy017]|uniref:bifunctional nuclease family protein n=1 Tax=unclassified Corynebacterium TaxID=2624378 RepID=UPI001185EC09|nr:MULTISPECIES: bifunctional nuclease family protein [unclassified Corynebacterium]MBP3087574.1 bifunctional nuclease family protein [Corynebacterium sp. sy017]TSD92150.1 bifunctional nuclease family protein [Corynebacterium sp. SY003]